jgi:hypothetical protein
MAKKTFRRNKLTAKVQQTSTPDSAADVRAAGDLTGAPKPNRIVAAYETGKLWDQFQWLIKQGCWSSNDHQREQVLARGDALVQQARSTRPARGRDQIERVLQEKLKRCYEFTRSDDRVRDCENANKKLTEFRNKKSL